MKTGRIGRMFGTMETAPSRVLEALNRGLTTDCEGVEMAGTILSTHTPDTREV